MVEAVEVGGRRLRGCCYCCYSATTTSNIAGTLQPPSLPFAAWSSLQPSHQYYSHEGVVGEVGGMRGILMDKVAVGHQNFQEELILLQNLAKHQVCQEKYVTKVGIVNITVCHSTYPGVLICIYICYSPTLLRKKSHLQAGILEALTCE